MRYRERSPEVEYVQESQGPLRIVLEHESIQDVNNGRKGSRPNTPCTHIKAKYDPSLVPLRWPNQGKAIINAPAYAYATYSRALVAPTINDHYDRCISKMDRLFNKQVGSFSSLNFLYELRELPDLFKKLKTPELLRPIDYYFAVAPTISDIKSALGSYDNAVSSLNDKLKKYRSIECNWTKSSTFLQDGEVSYFVGNSHYQSDTIRVTTRMRGTIEMDVPVLSRVSPQLYAVLDSLSVDISAGNAWNALPWSWFVDWFVPVGDFLESLPSTMKPEPRFVGTISHTINGFSDLESRNRGPAYYYETGHYGGKLKLSHYERVAFDTRRSSLVRWRVDNISSPRQIAILRDIMFPATVKKHVLRPSK